MVTVSPSGPPGLFKVAGSLPLSIQFITAGPFTKLCAWGRRRVEDMCYEIRRAEVFSIHFMGRNRFRVCRRDLISIVRFSF